jgi:hypothetical protein
MHFMKEMTRQIVARIPRSLEVRLARVARSRGRRRSEIIRMALEAYLGGKPSGTVWDRVRHLSSSLEGPADLSTNRKYLLEGFRDRRS